MHYDWILHLYYETYLFLFSSLIYVIPILGNKMKKEVQTKVECQGTSGAIYFFGIVGSVIYYVTTAIGFWMGALGIVKSFFWPGFLVYEIMKYLNI